MGSGSGSGDDHQQAIGAIATPIPILLEFPENVETSDEYSSVCSKVREACERHGFFLLRQHQHQHCCKIRKEELMQGMNSLFDLPEETKRRYQSPKPYHSYKGDCPVVPLHQSFGIDDAHEYDVARQFTNLMWPDHHANPNPTFCEVMQDTGGKLGELNRLVLRMIFGSFGVSDEQLNTYMQDSTAMLRLMKYRVPVAANDGAIGLVPHTDKNLITILCQNQVQGLEVIFPGHHNWLPVTVPQDAFIVIVGDTLKAWSNGRLHAVKHRVVMKGEKERYSCALFSIPKPAMTITVPNELIDTQHPLRYRPFIYADYISYFISNISDDALDTYAGI